MATSSLSGLGISGLSSGLDTSGIITKLMAIETAPQTALKSKLSSATTFRTALQSLNQSVAALATSSTAAARTGAVASFTATSDVESVTATASSTAANGAVSFTVDRLAKAQISVTGTMSLWPDTSSATPSITIQVGSGPSGRTTTVTALSTGLDDVVTAINGSGSGVTASKIATGVDSDGATQYRLQMRGPTGDGNGFAVFQGATTSSAQLATTEVLAAQSAQLTLYKGVAGAEQAVTSATNTFDDLLTGVDVTVSAVSAEPATVTVAADATAAATAAQTLTSGLITLFSGITAATAVATSTGSSGSTSTKGSVFTGDSTVRQLKDSLLTAASGAVDGKSPSAIGIAVTKDGTITFDQSKFEAVMASDPAGTTAMFQAIAGRVATVATAASDPFTGSLTQKVTSQQGTESRLTKEIGDWDSRLETIQSQYAKQFNALETALNALSSQASYLTSQIAGLTTNYQQTS